MFPFRKILLLLLSGIPAMAFSQSGYYPPPSSVAFHNDTLTIFPPDSLPVDPVVLLGYNIYVDSIFFDNITAINPADTIDFIFEIPELLPGNHEFCAKAFYNEWISDAACDTGLVNYGYELPFLEDWSSGGFDENLWETASGNWVVENNDGNPAPALQFKGNPGLTDYEVSIESYPIIATDMTVGRIWLNFNLKLDATVFSGNEWLYVQVWNWTINNWQTVAEYQNDEAWPWSSERINIRTIAMTRVFRIRFLATGLNSTEINSWTIDNIHLFRNCLEPSDLQVEEHLNYNQLNWDGWTGCGDAWIHWDDGVNSGNSIGTNDSVEFDVAARWTPEQLAAYQGASVFRIAFFPAESSATYHVRVWIGAGPDTLMEDQLVNSPVIGQWNYVTLTTPVLLDITKDLWVGYHVSTLTSYPAGVDDGPAIDGYGNMMYYDGNWSTLLEINPELDYNWNIACLLDNDAFNDPDVYFNVYRETNQGGLELYDIASGWEYQDDNIILSDYYCYKVTAVSYNDSDTCESDPTNTACEVVMLGTGQQEEAQNIHVYPNPVNDLLNIESEEMIREVRLYNPLGEMVVKLEIGNLEGKVDVSGLEKGLYFVEVICESRSYKSKVLVIH